MRIRDEDFDKYVGQVENPAKKAELEARKEELLALEKGKLLKPDNIEDEAVRSLVREHRERFKSFLSLSNILDEFSKAIETIGPTLEHPEILDHLKEVLSTFDHSKKSFDGLQAALGNHDLLPFYFELLENSKKDRRMSARKFYEAVGMVTGMAAGKNNTEAADKLAQALDGPAEIGAAQALAEMQDPRALEAIMEVIKKRGEKTPSDLFYTLSKIQGEEATAFLMECLQTMAKQDIQRTVARSLAERKDPRTFELLLAKGTSPETDEDVKNICFEGLGNLGDPRALHPLLRELIGVKGEWNFRLCQAIAKLLPAAESLSKEEFVALAKTGRYISESFSNYVLKIQDDQERHELFKSALGSGDRDAEDSVMDMLVTHPELAKKAYPAIVGELVKILNTRRSEGAFNIIVAQDDMETLLRNVPKFFIAYTFQEQIEKIVQSQPRRAVPVLVEMMDNSESFDLAVRLLDKIESGEVEDIFMNYLTHHENTPESKKLISRLIIRKSKKIVPYLMKIVSSAEHLDWDTYEAETGLAEIGGEEVVRLLLEQLKRPFDDEEVAGGRILKLAEKFPDERIIRALMDVNIGKSYGYVDNIADTLNRSMGEPEQKAKLSEIMIEYLKSKDLGKISLAAKVCGQMRDPSTIPALMEALYEKMAEGDETDTVTAALGNMGDSGLKAIHEELKKERNTPGRVAGVRNKLVMIARMNYYTNKDLVGSIIVDMLDDENVWELAVTTAGEYRIQAAVEKLSVIANAEGLSWNKREQAIGALGKIGGDEATKMLIELYEKETETNLEGFVGKIIAALVNCKHPQTIPVLFKGGKITDMMTVVKEQKIEIQDKKIQRVAAIYPFMGEWSDRLARYLSFENENNIVFCEKIAGKYSKRATAIFEGVVRCLQDNTLNQQNLDILWDYLDHVKIVTPKLVRAYLDASNKNEYFADVEALTTGIIDPGPDKAEIKDHPLYDEIIKTIYQNNSTSWTSYEKNKQCKDRTDDLKDYKIKDRYVLDLGASTDLVVKEGQTLDIQKLDPIKARFYNWSKVWSEMGYDKEKMLEDIEKKIDETFEKIKGEPWAEGAGNMEQKLFAIVVGSIISGKMADEAKNLLIGYQFAKYEDIRAYIQGTTDRVANARNKDYAYLGELHTFFADQIKEISRKMLGEAEKDQWMTRVLPAIFKELRAKEMGQEKEETLNRMNPKKEADMASFRKQISGVLKGKKWSVAKKMVLAKRQKIAKIAAAAGNPKYTDPKRIQLGSITLEDLLNTEENISLGKYNPETFSKYMAQKLMDTFEEELDQIEGELSKFESKESKGKQVKKLNGFITKNSASANARMVGGVCVSGDKTQWDDPLYLQMAFHDPEDNTCKGLVLMHVWEQDGKKYLIASLNPSSTYLYGVDEKSLFDQICAKLEDFASVNGISGVGFSTHKQIRTNRTGGEFENAMNKRIAEAKEKYQKNADLVFTDARKFSSYPQYTVDSADLIWLAEE